VVGQTPTVCGILRKDPRERCRRRHAPGDDRPEPPHRRRGPAQMLPTSATREVMRSRSPPFPWGHRL